MIKDGFCACSNVTHTLSLFRCIAVFGVVGRRISSTSKYFEASVLDGPRSTSRDSRFKKMTAMVRVDTVTFGTSHKKILLKLASAESTYEVCHSEL
jgi:hypothetical protein